MTTLDDSADHSVCNSIYVLISNRLLVNVCDSIYWLVDDSMHRSIGLTIHNWSVADSISKIIKSYDT